MMIKGTYNTLISLQSIKLTNLISFLSLQIDFILACFCHARTTCNFDVLYEKSNLGQSEIASYDINHRKRSESDYIFRVRQLRNL